MLFFLEGKFIMHISNMVLVGLLPTKTLPVDLGSKRRLRPEGHASAPPALHAVTVCARTAIHHSLAGDIRKPMRSKNTEGFNEGKAGQIPERDARSRRLTATHLSCR